MGLGVVRVFEEVVGYFGRLPMVAIQPTDLPHVDAVEVFLCSSFVKVGAFDFPHERG